MPWTAMFVSYQGSKPIDGASDVRWALAKAEEMPVQLSPGGPIRARQLARSGRGCSPQCPLKRAKSEAEFSPASASFRDPSPTSNEHLHTRQHQEYLSLDTFNFNDSADKEFNIPTILFPGVLI